MIIILSLFSGWAGPLDSFGVVGRKVPEKTSEKTLRNTSVFHSSYYLIKAKTYKNNDELQLALFFLKIAASLSPDDMEIVGEISDLKLTIDNKSDKYFKKGEKFYNQNKFEKARKQFLTALRYNPDHKDALDYLKNRLIPKEYINYTLEKNDSLKIISNKFYKDPELAFLIVYFNNLKSDTEPKPGEMLKIPILEPEFNQTIGDRRQDMISAKNLLGEKRFQEVVVITNKILGNDPLNKEAIKLKNEAFYQIGIQLSSQKKYFEAMDTFKKITPEYEGVNGAIQEAIQHELLKAENLLKEKKYEESIDLAEKILGYDPSNTAANKFISTSLCQQGRDLFIRKKYDESLHVLDKADPADDCAEKIRLAVKKAIKEQAEAHYIQGVKHFLNEELQSAIIEWEKTLKLNPKHDKAKKNINKARSLLEKLNKVK
ncbi:MAG: tetratricopeptide repeat protein [Proteobacteria bacterium]|nr:tetratricopeptide repeat protein [Pseudomonadota bacterium]